MKGGASEKLQKKSGPKLFLHAVQLRFACFLAMSSKTCRQSSSRWYDELETEKLADLGFLLRTLRLEKLSERQKWSFHPTSALKPYALSCDRVAVCWLSQRANVHKAGLLLRRPRTIASRWTIEGKRSFEKSVVMAFSFWSKFKRVCPQGLTTRAGISNFSNNCLMLFLNASVTNGNLNEK